MVYPIVSFLASHPIVIIAIGATITIIGALMPYAEQHLRPKEYIYIAWAESMQSNALLDYQRFEWPYGESAVVLPIPEPKQLEVTSVESATLMLLAPKSWEVEVWMGVEGMEPATRYHPKDSLQWSIRVEDLDASGKEITRVYLTSLKENGVEYLIQGVEWWNTAVWNETRRVQITRPPSP